MAEKIFMAAMELFSRKGFVEATVEEITRAADVGKGTFFNYFPSKEHVLGFLVEKQRGVVMEHMALARPGTMTSQQVLISLGRSLMRFPGKSPQLARSIVAAFVGNSEVREYIVREMTEGRRMITEIIHLGQQRGELNPAMPAAELARAIHHALFGTLVLWSLDPVSSLEKQFLTTIEMVFSGLGATVETKSIANRKKTPAARHAREAR
jgi:AcrR family transcriptional regulator